MKPRTPIAFAAVVAIVGFVSQVYGAEAKEVHFYSEGVLAYGKLHLPASYSDATKSPAVVLAPGSAQTSASLGELATQLAARGIVALTFDYRGWGKSGGLLYFGEPMHADDRLRFSQTTAKMVIRRKRIEPSMQLIDIRNAITFLQGEVGVDRARIGVWGINLSADHAIVVAATDARVKAIVAESPQLQGKDSIRKAFAPSKEQQASMIKLARSGAAPTTPQAANAMNADETKLALTEYRPYWYVDGISEKTAVRLLLSDKENDGNATAAAKLLKGANDVVKFSADAAAKKAATEWFASHL